MSGASSSIVEQAVAWHAASENDDMDWDGFTKWLESDPSHRSVYDEVALADLRVQEIAAARGGDFAANDRDDIGAPAASVRARSGWMRWAGTALAASLVALLAVPQFLAGQPQVYVTQVEGRTIALADGSSVTLAPQSRLEVEDGEQEMRLAGGGWFDIRHVPDRQLTIRAGDLAISDIGTSFDIQSDKDTVRVAVGEGVVNIASDRLPAPVTLSAGNGLFFDGSAGTVQTGASLQAEPGAWRSGRLSYDAAPLKLVAADLARYAHLKIAVAGPLQEQTFSGTLNFTDGKAAVRDLSQLMGVGLVADGDTFRLVPSGG